MSDIEAMAAHIRLDALQLWRQTRGPLAGALSIIDAYTVLFFRTLTTDEWAPSIPLLRVLPKSSGAVAFYATLKHAGLWHHPESGNFSPVIRRDGWIGGVSGTLTKNFDQALGMALMARRSGKCSPVIVFLSEGDLQSGVDQQAKLASLWDLSNVTVIVDCNGMQSSSFAAAADPTIVGERFTKLEQIWKGYGWDYSEVNGHDYVELERAFASILQHPKPLLIVARTIKGRGVPFIENNPIRYSHKIQSEELDDAVSLLRRRIAELDPEGRCLMRFPVPLCLQAPRDEEQAPLALPSPAIADEGTAKLTLKNWMDDFTRLNSDRVAILDSDNPYPFAPPARTYPADRDSCRIFVGVNERLAVNIARGIANAGYYPIYGSPATHLQVATEDFMWCAKDRDRVLLIGYLPGSDLAFWGLTHNSSRDCILFGFPEAHVFQSATLEDIYEILNRIYQEPTRYLPAYFRLPSDAFHPSGLGYRRLDVGDFMCQGYYYFCRSESELEAPEVLLLASGTLLCECAQAAQILSLRGVRSLLVNVISLTQILVCPSLVEAVKCASVVITVIDADPTVLSNVCYAAIEPDDRPKVVAIGLRGFSRGLHSRDEVLRQNGLDAEGLASTALTHLSLRMKWPS